MPTFEDKESLASVRTKINDTIVAVESLTGFNKVAVAGQGNIDADTKSSTLNLEAGSNIVITTNASTDTVTISSTASGGGGGGVTDGDKGDITVSAGGTVWTIDNGAVDLATKVSGTLPAANFNDTAHGTRAGGTLHADATTSVSGFMSGADKTKLDGIATGANLYVHPSHTGDVTSVADGATTITANAVTNAKLAQAVANTLKGNNTGATANVADLTTSQVKTMLAITTADVSGLGTLATQSGTFSGASSGTNTGDQNIFQNIAVSGQTTIAADTTTDTLTLAAGAGVSISTNAATDTITVTNSAPDQTVSLAQAGTVTVTGTYPSFTITGAATDLSYTASTRVLASSTGVDATLPIFTSTDAGLVPASGGGTTTFLRADGTWATAGSGSVSDPLQLSANSAATPTYSFSTDTDTGLYLAGVNSLGVSAGGSNKMTVDSTGVFVNNTSGSDPFEVTADTLSSAFTVRGRSSDDIATTSFYDNARTTRYGYLQSTPTKMRLGSQAPIPLELLTDNTAQLTLGTTGEIGLGSGVNNGIQGEVLTSNGTGVSPSWGGAEYWLMQNSTYTLTSTTAIQKLFNASPNGTLNLPVGTYMFECVMYITSMSTISGNTAFWLRGSGGTAVIPNSLMHSWGHDAGAGAIAASTGGTYWTTLNSPASIVVISAVAAMLGRVHGVFRISGDGGTLIPSVALAGASAAIVQPSSYFWCKRLSASDTATTFGPWT